MNAVFAASVKEDSDFSAPFKGFVRFHLIFVRSSTNRARSALADPVTHFSGARGCLVPERGA